MTQYNADGDDACEEAFSWNEMVIRDKVHPELELPTLLLIEKGLGYIPRQSLTVAYETNLRLFYHRYLFGDFDLAELYYRTDEILKLMREWDLKPDNKLFDTPDIYNYYKQNYLPYMQQAYRRISQHLGYKPDSKYSMAAEIWLAQVLAKDITLLTDNITPYDYRAMTSVKYRELWLNEGEEVANASPLLARQPIG
ncbi:MAG TPA: hypothetical protein VGE24_11985 [Emticicia sp.]